MAANLVRNALSEVLPGYDPVKVPTPLVTFVGRLYALSSRKLSLKPNEEIVRYHLCAILGVEKLRDKLELPEPVSDAVAVAPSTLKRLLAEGRTNLLNDASAISNPATPSKPRASRTPSKRTPSASPAPSTPGNTPAKRRLFSSPKTPGSGSESPAKRSRGRPPGALNRTTLEKIGQSPFQTASTEKKITPFSSPNKKVYLSSAEVISFCNTFQLPQTVTQHVLSTFIDFHNRIKHEWALLCGLVALVYYIIHHDGLDVSGKRAFFEKLHGTQRGNLLKQSLTEWITLINEFFKDARWVKQLKLEYNFYHDSTSEIPSMGNMLSVNPIFQHEDAYHQWRSQICSNAAGSQTPSRSRSRD